MGMKDAVIVIKYDVEDPLRTCIHTNVRTKALKEVLGAWLEDQIGRGEDKSPFDRRDVYTIKIRLDLTDDTFRTTSDTGNEGLVAGIVMDVFHELDAATIKTLEGLDDA